MNTPAEKTTIQNLINHQNTVIKDQGWQCCLNCINWDKKKQQCGLFNANPPLQVIVVGCVEYEGDIPF